MEFWVNDNHNVSENDSEETLLFINDKSKSRSNIDSERKIDESQSAFRQAPFY